jgi:hypothetical protein
MSVSRHPVALRLEQQVGGATKLLATVMALPLIDGIFPALVIAGALTYPFGIIETGLLIFGGSATVAVILAEMDGTRRQQVTAVLLVGVFLIPAAAVEAALAPSIKSMMNIAIFQRFAGVVILAVAAKTASSKVGEYLPRPAVIIGLGMIASFQPAGAELAFVSDPMLVVRAAAAAGVGVGFALLVALLGPRLRGSVDIDLFRFGSSVALGMLALSVLGLMPTDAPVALGVLAVTAMFAFDPSADGEVDADEAAARGPEAPDHVVDGPDRRPIQVESVETFDAAVADGGDSHRPIGDVSEGSEHGYQRDESREPWL